MTKNYTPGVWWVSPKTGAVDLSLEDSYLGFLNVKIIGGYEKITCFFKSTDSLGFYICL